MSAPTIARDTLRHLLAALSYRFEHAVADAPAGFDAFDAGAGVRSPLELVRHLGGLMRFAGALWTGGVAPTVEPRPWADEVAAFRHELRGFDAILRRSPTPTGTAPAERVLQGRVLQGPLLDAVTHVGQLLTLRRLGGAPVARRRYVDAELPALDADG